MEIGTGSSYQNFSDGNGDVYSQMNISGMVRARTRFRHSDQVVALARLVKAEYAKSFTSAIKFK